MDKMLCVIRFSSIESIGKDFPIDRTEVAQYRCELNSGKFLSVVIEAEIESNSTPTRSIRPVNHEVVKNACKYDVHT